MVDAADSKSAGGDLMGVQVPSRAPIWILTYNKVGFYFYVK